MPTAPTANALDYDALKDKHRELRTGFPDWHSLRIHRALSWLKRSEKEVSDHDVRFILLWIGFNAAYASEFVSDDVLAERDNFRSYFELLVNHDQQQRIYASVWERFPHEIRLLLGNHYVFMPFWKHQNGVAGYDDWKDRLVRSSRVISTALSSRDTTQILCVVFDRLYVLRNQLVHGGATWNGGKNRDQVRDGAAVLAWLLPIFVDIMMDNPNADWGKPFYPVVE